MVQPGGRQRAVGGRQRRLADGGSGEWRQTVAGASVAADGGGGGLRPYGPLIVLMGLMGPCAQTFFRSLRRALAGIINILMLLTVV